MNTAFEIALSQYGVKEIVGDKHNPVILNYFDCIGHSWVHNDETAWCAAFVNYCLNNAGYEGTGKLNARSFLDCGTVTDHPETGDIVVLWRGSILSWKGHVGFYVNETASKINILGGNQSNQVKISSYPKVQLLSYRKI